MWGRLSSVLPLVVAEGSVPSQLQMGSCLVTCLKDHWEGPLASISHRTPYCLKSFTGGSSLPLSLSVPHAGTPEDKSTTPLPG